MVCVNYSDFLNITLPINHKQFDNIVVVTSESDSDTINVCEKFDNVKCCITNRLHENGDKFNKGKAINDGLKLLSRSDWVLITDADMVLNNSLRDCVKFNKLNSNNIYGTSRYMCPDHKSWKRYLKDKSIHESWIHQCGRKTIGVGFFQLVNGKNDILSNNYSWYSEQYGHCGRSDRMFLRLFEDKCRKKLNLPCIHLGCDDMSANWYGRVTKKFDSE